MTPKQTAVEWLVEQLQAPCKGIPSHILEQALAMEKEQIMDSYTMGSYDMAAKEFRPEQYYNETYGTHKQNLPGEEGHS
jgi:hypothetical protein